MRKTRGEILLSVAILVAIIFTSVFSFAQVGDIEKHWAKEEISNLIQNNIVSGYTDGTFKPDNNITRAEFYKIIDELFGYERLAEINFSDVKEGNWFYDYIRKGVKAGYILEEKEAKPNAYITREEVARILGITFNLGEEEEGVEVKFADAEDISGNAKGYIKVLQEKGFIKGYKDGTFRPKGNITRAEAAKMISNVCKCIVKTSGEYSKNIEGNVVISAPDVTLKDMTINGNLYISEGLGKGSLTLKNVTVKEKIYINAGEKDKLNIENITAEKVVINKDGAKIDFKNSKIKTIEVQSKDVEIKCDGNIDKVVAKEKVVVNGKVVEKGKELNNISMNIEESNTGSGSSGGGSSSGSGSGGGGSSSGGGSSGGGNSGGDIPVVKNISATFHSSPLKNFGKVAITKIEGIDGAETYTVTFKYSDGIAEETVGPVKINEKTSEIYYNGNFSVTIKIYGKDVDRPLHVFENVQLLIADK